MKEVRQLLYEITYIWNLKNNTNECICKTETNLRYRKQISVPKDRGKGEGQINGIKSANTNYYI